MPDIILYRAEEKTRFNPLHSGRFTFYKMYIQEENIYVYDCVILCALIYAKD